MPRRLAYLLPTLFIGCGMPPEPSPTVARTQLAQVGVPQNGYPTYDERLQLVAQNRTRSDPNHIVSPDPLYLSTMDACSAIRAAVPPLDYHYDLAQSARFHCAHSMLNDGGLTHKSYCNLRADVEGCDGSAACSCLAGTECWSCTTLGGCGTTPFTRMGYFGFTGNAENGAAGYNDSWQAVWAWITECVGSDGHRVNVTSSGSNVVGTGSYGPGACWSALFFSDYGNDPGRLIPRIPSGVHRPESGTTSTTFTLYANWYDQSTGDDPLSIDAVIDGTCYPMAVELGATGNRTYQYATTLPAGCREYYILARDSGGTRVTYPEVGSLLVAVSGGPCAGDYDATQLPASCEAAMDAGTPDVGTPDVGTPDVGTPDAGAADGGTAVDGGTMADAGTGVDASVPEAGIPDEDHDIPPAKDAAAPDEGVGKPDEGTGNDDDGGTDADGGAEPEGSGGCSCALGHQPAAGGWWLLLTLLLRPTRRRPWP